MDSILGIPSKTYAYINDFGMNVYVLGILVMVIVVYYAFFSKLVRDATTGETSMYARMLEVSLWAVFIVLVLLNGLQYFFNINFTTEISSLFTSNPKLDLKVKEHQNYDRDKNDVLLSRRSGRISGRSTSSRASTSGSTSTSVTRKGEGVAITGATSETSSGAGGANDEENEKGTEREEKRKGKGEDSIKMSGKTGVFHIPANKYTYEDSKQVCKAYGARLATYNEIEKAYEEGGDWCSYGWTDSQMVLYPTQKERWEKLQEIEGHEHACGRPGVNGGYIANPNAEFGINCYGKRPEASAEDKKRMENTVIYPKTAEELQFEKDVKKWKKKLSTMDLVIFGIVTNTTPLLMKFSLPSTLSPMERKNLRTFLPMTGVFGPFKKFANY